MLVGVHADALFLARPSPPSRSARITSRLGGEAVCGALPAGSRRGRGRKGREAWQTGVPSAARRPDQSCARRGQVCRRRHGPLSSHDHVLVMGRQAALFGAPIPGKSAPRQVETSRNASDPSMGPGPEAPVSGLGSSWIEAWPPYSWSASICCKPAQGQKRATYQISVADVGFSPCGRLARPLCPAQRNGPLSAAAFHGSGACDSDAAGAVRYGYSMRRRSLVLGVQAVDLRRRRSIAGPSFSDHWGREATKCLPISILV